MPRTRKEDDRAEAFRAHAEVMRAKWAAAAADIDGATSDMRNKWRMTNPEVPTTWEFKNLFWRFFVSSSEMLDYTRKVEGKLNGAAGGGIPPPNDLQPSFNKLKDWLDTANTSDLPSFPKCFVLLEELMEWYKRCHDALHLSTGGGGIR